MLKKFTALILALVMCLPLAACGKKEPEFNLRDEIKLAIQAKASVECLFNYANVKLVLVDTLNYDDNGDGTYDCKGYISITDDYGDKYRGKFDAVVKVVDEDASVSSFELETPKKSN